MRGGGPAFPMHAHPGGAPEFGMSLRDYFAAKAMQANIAASGPGTLPDCRGASEWSYRMADAMLAERAK